MNRFLQWLRDFTVSETIRERQAVDEAISQAFSSDRGKMTLDYLISEHYAFVTAQANLDQVAFNEGRRFVLQDILDSIDRHRMGAAEITAEGSEE